MNARPGRAPSARQSVINISLGIIERYVSTVDRIVTVTRTANRIVGRTEHADAMKTCRK